jgi:hypothetical protein
MKPFKVTYIVEFPAQNETDANRLAEQVRKIIHQHSGADRTTLVNVRNKKGEIILGIDKQNL